MPTVIDRQRLISLLDEGAVQLVEVLPRDEYDEEHLPGAVNLPLRDVVDVHVDHVLDRERPVVVYCWDAL